MSETDIANLLRPYLLPDFVCPTDLYGKLATYLGLLLKWNARTNLSAIRDPVDIVGRHFGESLFAAQYLGACETLLDYGSGAGFPGLPIQLASPGLLVTLGESQNKKAAFLREVVRSLGLKTTVWADRVEAMPASMRFDVVTLRAVDNMVAAVTAAGERAAERVVVLATAGTMPQVAGFDVARTVPLPGSREGKLIILQRNKGNLFHVEQS